MELDDNVLILNRDDNISCHSVSTGQRVPHQHPQMLMCFVWYLYTHEVLYLYELAIMCCFQTGSYVALLARNLVM